MFVELPRELILQQRTQRNRADPLRPLSTGRALDALRRCRTFFLL